MELDRAQPSLAARGGTPYVPGPPRISAGGVAPPPCLHRSLCRLGGVGAPCQHNPRWVRTRREFHPGLLAS